MTQRLYLDTETCGFHGPIVLIQYAVDNGRIRLHEVWRTTVGDTLELIESFLDKTVVCFNLAFDWFHINQLYNCLLKLPKDKPPNIKEYAAIEAEARDGVCVKPVSCLDLMLHAYKGPYQSTMDRDDIRITRVPTCLGQDLCDYLDKAIPFKDIYFARNKDRSKRWRVAEIEDCTEFVDIVLDFKPTTKLKALAQDALGYCADDILTIDKTELPGSARPDEIGYAPFNQACTGITWVNHIWRHIEHWSENPLAIRYAEDDIKYTRGLDRYFGMLGIGASEEEARRVANDLSIESSLVPADDDESILAAMVGAIRWKGYNVNIEALTELRAKAISDKKKAPHNFNSQRVCLQYLSQVMSEEERLSLIKDGVATTDKITLEQISKWTVNDVCLKCNGFGCPECNEGFVPSGVTHPAAIRAKEIIDFRAASKEIELYDKLITAGRFHASFKIIGAKSSRMSGSDGLNAQGIKRTKVVRSCFPLAWDGYVLTGGDFKSFEVGLMDAAYGDPQLREDLLAKVECDCVIRTGKIKPNCEDCNGTGKCEAKIHAIFGQFLFPGKSYRDIIGSKGLPGNQDIYTRSKNGVFAMAYGGEGYTLATRVGIPESVGDAAYQKWVERYKIWGAARRKIYDMFCSMRQPNGIGTKVEWHDPADYIATMLDFRRYFTLENRVCEAIFKIAENPPKRWYEYKIKVIRREREQTATGALRSALFGCAFKIQAANMRAAANHVIQGTGAQLTKKLQREIWSLQPAGVHKFVVMPCNIHDEIMNPALPEYVDKVDTIVKAFVDRNKSLVPMLGIDWSNNLKTWADK